jgi:hypothetical protein
MKEAHGEHCGVSYNINAKTRKLEPKSVVNVLLIDLTSKTFKPDGGSEISYYEHKNFGAKCSDQLAEKLAEKYHATEPIFEKILKAKSDETKTNKKLSKDFSE